MLDREHAMFAPPWVARHVGHDHRSPGEGRRPARAGRGPDGQSVHRLGVGGGQARRRAAMQAQARFVEQQDRGAHIVELRFDEPRQAFEDVGQGRAGRDHFEDLRLAVPQRLRQLARRDVARDSDEADDLAAVVAQRHLGRGHPDLPSGRIDDVFLDVDQRLAGLEDAPLVGEVLSGDVGCVQFEIRAADQIAGRGEADLARRGVIGDDETAGRVLHPEIVRHEVDQPLQRNPLGDDRAALVKLGHVVVGRDPAALRRRLEMNFDPPSARKARAPGFRRFVGGDRMAQLDVIVGRAGALSGHELPFGDVAQRGARQDFVRGKAVNLGESPVAPDQPAFRVEEGNALPDILDRRLVARRLRLEARNDGCLLADDDVLRLDHGAAQRGEARVGVSVGQRGGLPVVQYSALRIRE